MSDFGMTSKAIDPTSEDRDKATKDYSGTSRQDSQAGTITHAGLEAATPPRTSPKQGSLDDRTNRERTSPRKSPGGIPTAGGVTVGGPKAEYNERLGSRGAMVRQTVSTADATIKRSPNNDPSNVRDPLVPAFDSEANPDRRTRDHTVDNILRTSSYILLEHAPIAEKGRAADPTSAALSSAAPSSHAGPVPGLPPMNTDLASSSIGVIPSPGGSLENVSPHSAMPRTTASSGPGSSGNSRVREITFCPRARDLDPSSSTGVYHYTNRVAGAKAAHLAAMRATLKLAAQPLSSSPDDDTQVISSSLSTTEPGLPASARQPSRSHSPPPFPPITSSRSSSPSGNVAVTISDSIHVRGTHGPPTHERTGSTSSTAAVAGSENSPPALPTSSTPSNVGMDSLSESQRNTMSAWLDGHPQHIPPAAPAGEDEDVVTVAAMGKLKQIQRKISKRVMSMKKKSGEGEE